MAAQAPNFAVKSSSEEPIFRPTQPAIILEPPVQAFEPVVENLGPHIAADNQLQSPQQVPEPPNENQRPIRFRPDAPEFQLEPPQPPYMPPEPQINLAEDEEEDVETNTEILQGKYAPHLI